MAPETPVWLFSGSHGRGGAGHKGRSAMDTHQPVGPGPGWLPRCGELGETQTSHGAGGQLGAVMRSWALGAAMRLLARSWGVRGRGGAGMGGHPRVQLSARGGRRGWLLRLLLSSPAHSVLFPAPQLGNGYRPGDPARPPSQGGRSGRRTRLPNSRAWPQVRGRGAVPASAKGGLTRSVTGSLSKTHV